MKNFKIILSLLLVTVLLLTSFVACNSSDGQSDTTPNSDSSDTSGESDATELVTIIKKETETTYVIIYADDVSSSVKSAAQGISYRINTKCKVEVPAYAETVDWGCPYSSDKEILIGNTTAEETAEAKKLLKGNKDEYAIKLFENGKIAIVASSDSALLEATNYFLSTFIIDGEYPDEIKMPKDYEYYGKIAEADPSDVWKLSAPVYNGGVIAPKTYNIGKNGTLSSSSNAGRMQTVSETNAEEFNSYIETLKNKGYTQTANTEVNGNIYYQFTKNSKCIYAYFTAFCGEARIIEDYSSTTEAKFEYTYTPKAGETAAIYQYGLMQNPTGLGGTITETKRYENNGAFLIIRLSDNSLVLIDGGRDDQATEAATDKLMDFLFEITGVDPNGSEKARISAFFFSHGDGDHVNFSYMLMANDKYTDRLEVERIMHNIPADAIGGADKNFAKFGELVYKKYPNVKFLKLHTGQSIQLADATFDVLYTHEDMVDAATGDAKVKHNNNLLSTMFKLTLNGKTFLAMGDWGVGAREEQEALDKHDLCEERFLGMYEDAKGNYPFLECDILQVAHHAINDYNARVHAIVKADYAFFSQQDIAYDDLAHDCYRNIVNQLRAAGMEDQHMYFQGRQTNWLTIDQSGNITHGHKKLEGVDEGYYYYTDADGNVLYEDADGKVTTEANGNTRITDTTGDATFEGISEGKKVYVKGYWELLEPYEPFWPANNT